MDFSIIWRGTPWRHSIFCFCMFTPGYHVSQLRKNGPSHDHLQQRDSGMKPSTTYYNGNRIQDATKHMLVGGLNPSEKYDFVSWDDDILN